MGQRGGGDSGTIATQEHSAGNNWDEIQGSS